MSRLVSRLLSSTIGLGVLLFRLAERRLAKASLYDQAAGEVDASVVVVLTVLSVTESAMSALRDPGTEMVHDKSFSGCPHLVSCPTRSR